MIAYKIAQKIPRARSCLRYNSYINDEVEKMLTNMKYTPESKGISSRALLNFLEKTNRKKIPMHSFLIAKGDDICSLRYRKIDKDAK